MGLGPFSRVRVRVRVGVRVGVRVRVTVRVGVWVRFGDALGLLNLQGHGSGLG